MIVVDTINITRAMLTATNAVDEPAWAVGTTYAQDAAVGLDDVRWVSLQPGNLGKDPRTEPLWWRDAGPVNSLAMFDDSNETATSRVGGLSFTVAPGGYQTSIGFTGLVGAAITLDVYRDAELLLNESRVLMGGGVSEWDWYFSEPDQVSDTYWYSLPMPATHYVVTITGGFAAVGRCLVGRQHHIGEAQFGVSLSTELRGRDYINANGNPVATERGHSRTLSATLEVKRAEFNRVTALFERLVQRPAFWLVAPGLGDYDNAALYGRYQRAVRVINGPDLVTVALEVAGFR